MTDKFIIESFWQKAGNCASIALIKAAILKYGLKKVVRIRKVGNQDVITLRNKRMLVFQPGEIEKINEKNQVQYSKPQDETMKTVQVIRHYVNICLAVMIRILQIDGYNGKEYNQTQAIKLLTKDGMPTNKIHMLLGLKRRTPGSQKISLKHLTLFKKKKGVLLYSDFHITVASKGFYEDFGKAVPFSKEIPILKRRKARFWFELSN